MYDGWWKKVQKLQKVYIDGWWLMEENTESTESKKVQKVQKVNIDEWWLKVQKEQNETFWWDIFMRHFEETFGQDILTKHIDGLWKTLMTCIYLWYGYNCVTNYLKFGTILTPVCHFLGNTNLVEWSFVNWIVWWTEFSMFGKLSSFNIGLFY